MKTNFTPGPWKQTGTNVRTKDGGLICTAMNHWADTKTPLAEKKANARLISRAPLMLETVEMTTQFLTRFLETIGDLENDKTGLSVEASLLLIWCESVVSSANGTDENLLND